MHSRYLVATLLSGLLGFVCLFVVDIVAQTINISHYFGRISAPEIVVPTDMPAPFAGDIPGHPTFVWIYSTDSRCLASPYQSLDRKPLYPGLPKGMPTDSAPSFAKKGQWQQLYFQLLFLDWLRNRGAGAGYLAAVVSLIAGCSLIRVDRYRKARQPQIEATV